MISAASAGVLEAPSFAYSAHPAPAPLAYAAPAAPLAYAAAPFAKIATPLAYAAPAARLAYAAPAAPFAYSAPIAKAAPLAVSAKTVVADDYDPNPQYSFGYDVQDGLTGDSKSQQESRSGDVVQGKRHIIILVTREIRYFQLQKRSFDIFFFIFQVPTL